MEPSAHNAVTPPRGSRASASVPQGSGNGGPRDGGPQQHAGPQGRPEPAQPGDACPCGPARCGLGLLGARGVTAPSSRGAIGSLMSPRAGRQDFRSVLRGEAPAEQGAAPQPAGGLAGGFQYPGFCPEGTSRSLLLHPCLVLALRPPLPRELAARASKRMCHCQADSDPLLVPPLPTVQQTPH